MAYLFRYTIITFLLCLVILTMVIMDRESTTPLEGMLMMTILLSATNVGAFIDLLRMTRRK